MGKRKILVADPDSVVQQVASYFLKLEGFEVETTGDGVSAMEMIEKISPDIIIMSPVLPGITGVEVSHFVMENPQYRSIPVIFLTESDEPLLSSLPDLSRTFGIINKPIDPTRLVNTIKEFLAKGSAPAEDVMESLKSIEELLGWDISDKNSKQQKEEVLQGNSGESSFDVSELLAGAFDDTEKGADVNTEIQHSEAFSACQPKPFAEFDSSLFSSSPGDEMAAQFKDYKRNDAADGFSEEAFKEIEAGVESPSDTRRTVNPHINDEPAGEHEDVTPVFISGTEQEIIMDAAAGSDISGPETTEPVKSDLKDMISDDMIENIVRKIASDIVERVTREIVPDIAEREITKEIERLKGIE